MIRFARSLKVCAMKMYSIVYSDMAKEQLNQLVLYIVQDSGDIDVAIRYYDRIEEAIEKLSGYPYLGSNPSDSILRLQGYRMLVIERHLAFYKVNDTEKRVCISGIFDSRMEYRFLLQT